MATDYNDTPDMSEPGTSDKYRWLTTLPNPRRPATGHDAGVTGWKLHAVEASETDKFTDLGRMTALCGLRPRHGWSLDLFIEDECQKCVAAMDRLEKQQPASAPTLSQQPQT